METVFYQLSLKQIKQNESKLPQLHKSTVRNETIKILELSLQAVHAGFQKYIHLRRYRLETKRFSLPNF